MLLLILIPVVLAVLWVPMVVVLLLRKAPLMSTIGLYFLIAEFISVVVLTIGADFAGLLNPAGYLAGITVLVSICGAFILSFIVKPPINQTHDADAKK